MAERGRETLRHGPMKPVGLTNPRKPDVKPYAIVQLRQDNALGTLYNMVGFQTRLRYAIQADIFRMIPGLAERPVRPPRRAPPQHFPQFSPSLLDGFLRLKADPRLRFAGQITGCEGYVESAAIGLVAGPHGGGRASGEASRAAAGRPPPSAPSSAISPAATCPPTTSRASARSSR